MVEGTGALVQQRGFGALLVQPGRSAITGAAGALNPKAERIDEKHCTDAPSMKSMGHDGGNRDVAMVAGESEGEKIDVLLKMLPQLRGNQGPIKDATKLQCCW